MYWLLNIYRGILMSESPMAAHCQHTLKLFTCCSFNLTVSLYITCLLSINTDIVYQEKALLELLNNFAQLSTSRHFDVRDHNTSSPFVIKPAVKLRVRAFEQYRCTAPLRAWPLYKWPDMSSLLITLRKASQKFLTIRYSPIGMFFVRLWQFLL